MTTNYNSNHSPEPQLVATPDAGMPIPRDAMTPLQAVPTSETPEASAPAERIIYINFFQEINDATVRGVMTLCSQIHAQKKADRLYFLFASGGGSVMAGAVLYSFLRGLPMKITMHNTGAINSIANTIFAAADERFATPHSTFMFHGVGFNVPQGGRFELKQLLEMTSGIQADQAKIAGILSSRTKLTAAEIEELFRQGQTKDPTFALDKGIITEIKEITVPAGAPVLTVDFK